jgi:hypothetical protein
MLTTSARYEIFNATEIARLFDVLESDITDRFVLKVADKGDLSLSLSQQDKSTAVLREGYRYTPQALAQLCSKLVGGLGNHLAGITDGRNLRGKVSANYDALLAHAMNTFNRDAAFFEKSVVGSRMIGDSKRKLIEGIVGPRYVFVSNKRVMESVVEAASAMSGHLRFSSAILDNRDLHVVYRAADNTVVTNSHLGNFYYGVLTQNGETGSKAIRSANVLFDAKTKSWSSDVFVSETRIRHVSESKVTDKLMQLTDVIVSRQITSKDVASLVTLASSTKAFERKEADAEKYAIALARRLGIFDVRASVAKQVVRAVLNDNPLQVSVFSKLHVYESMLNVASRLGSAEALSLRQVAYKLVFGGALK